MTANGFEIETKLDNTHLSLRENPNVSANLFADVYQGPGQFFKNLKHKAEVTKESLDISHQKWTQGDVNDIKDIYKTATEKYGATKEDVAKALEDRANEINKQLDKHNSALRVEVSVRDGKGFKDGEYTFAVVDKVHHKTVGMVKFGDHNTKQPIEVISTD